MIFKNTENFEEKDLENKIELLKAKGFSAKNISVILSELYNFNKNLIYKKTVNNL